MLILLNFLSLLGKIVNLCIFILILYDSFLEFVLSYLFVYDTERQRDRENSCSLVNFPNATVTRGWDSDKARTRNSLSESHMSDRDPNI